MEPAIFISYSRDDERHAKHLLALLRRQGYSVWIDQEAIAGASIWSDEIVDNIKKSDIFIALISAASAASNNVGKEIALAAEHGKVILPIEIGTAKLPGRLEYALAGIQRTSFNDEDAILHAVRSQVAKLEGSEGVASLKGRSRSHVKRLRTAILLSGVLVITIILFLVFQRSSTTSKSDNAVAVLPFATLNLDKDSTHNLDIFSEGILTRLTTVNTLSTVAASVSATYKDSRLNALAIARELNARFIVEGLVRKTHDVNFISVRIFDAKKGGEIWEESFTGNNRELFPIREHIAGELTSFLHDVTGSEMELQQAEAELAAHPNDASANARVANMLLGTDKTRSLDLFNKAIKLDSGNFGYYLSAGIVAERESDRSLAKAYGRIALRLCTKQVEAHPDSALITINYVLALDMAGDGEEAEAVYDSLLHRDPANVRLNYNYACCLARQGKADQTVDLLSKLFTFAPGKKNEVLSDPDFDNIRSSPRYQKLMYGFGQ
ncbi:MAG TPA: TIR domain-containing protein [Candidatus Kapabacteria bacterium]|nr:TIR domain-containing protein [Candidatus Kapabacteria bacterium]